MSELRVGYCHFCGDPVNVPIERKDGQKTLNVLATEKCECHEAKEHTKLKKEEEKCIGNINKVLGEKHPTIAELFKSGIGAIQHKDIKKITIATCGTDTTRIYSTPDGIKVELEKKTKTELST